jgi:AAA ATPase domain
MTFVGRHRELEIPCEELRSVRDGQGRFIWMRGRRRVGKSRLVEEFLHRSGIRAAYYQAPRRTTEVALRRFAETIAESGLPAADLFGSGVSFDSWPAALRASTDGATDSEPIALFRGKAIEPLVRRSVERLLIDPNLATKLDGARYVGSYWTRDNQIEVDLVGADAENPKRVAFIGSIKWRTRSPFGPRDAQRLAEQSADVPGAAAAKLVGVSISGFADDADLDVRLDPPMLIDAWR